MKDKIIETAGKMWRYLGENGETPVTQITKKLKEKDVIVYQALGWLAREDKINYQEKSRTSLISLVEGEERAYRYLYPGNETRTATEKPETKKARRKKIRMSTSLN